MADVGPGEAQLIVKRIETEIGRLHYSIQQQELELMEADDRRSRIERNIDASRKALEEQEHNLEVTKEQYAEALNG